MVVNVPVVCSHLSVQAIGTVGIKEKLRGDVPSVGINGKSVQLSQVEVENRVIVGRGVSEVRAAAGPHVPITATKRALESRRVKLKKTELVALIMDRK